MSDGIVGRAIMLGFIGGVAAVLGGSLLGVEPFVLATFSVACMIYLDGGSDD